MADSPNSKDNDRGKPDSDDPGLFLYIYRHLWDIFEDGALRAGGVVFIALWLCWDYYDLEIVVKFLIKVFGPLKYGMRCLIFRWFESGGPHC